MTTENEKHFFDTFGIKQREYTQCCSMGCKKPYTDCVNCQYHEVYKIDYPQISDRILLELICTLLSNLGDWNVEKLKDTVLTMCIKPPDLLEWEDTSEYFKNQVQALFKEE